jgi:hypothetical protein
VNLFYTNRGLSYENVVTLLRSRITYFLMIGLGALLGALFIAQDQYLRDAPTTFRKTPCLVEDVDVRVTRRGRRSYPASYYPAVTFTFTATDGRDHRARGYRLYELGVTKGEAEEMVHQYARGQHTYCYYDPADPDHAVLTLDADGRGVGLLGGASILLLLGGVVGWVVVDFVCKAPVAERVAVQG